MKKKIGLLTLPFDPNYGWALQLWALYHHLENNGYDVEVIDRRWNETSPNKVKDIKRWIYYNIFCRNFFKFFKKEFKRSAVIRSSASMKSNYQSKKYDSVIVGSDQVWRIEYTRGSDLNYFLDFLDGFQNVKRVAYAASFGNDSWKGTDQETKKVSYLLKSFDLVSVRERSGVEICDSIFNVKASHVLDPTMLLKASDYSPIINKKISCNNSTVTYILDFNKRKSEIVDLIAKKYNDKIKHLYTKKRQLFTFYSSIEEWLSSIATADFVIVDSFHGMVFSILFEKQFLVIGNKARGMARFESLLKQLGLENRLIKEDYNNEEINSIIEKQIDYIPVRKIINNLRNTSENLLIDSLF